ncbi:MAG: tyrosine-type recombinase/integrase [Hyalangium sp.]|uniref:tyrosine-type recombinase/integrase n=1 Tax=Hyalangium sp. TaxID=2028555 RepID=UPI00389ADF78
MSLLLRAPQPVDAEQLEDGTYTVAFQGQLFQEPPFAQLAQHYLANLQGEQKRTSTRKGEASYLKQALAWLGERGIERPSTADWKRYFDWRLSPQCPNRVTPSTVHGHHCTIRKVYRRCAEAPLRGWLLIPNPVTTAFLPAYYDPLNARPRAMMEPYVTVPLLKASMPDPVAKALVEVLDNQGLRIQEALGIPMPGSYVEREVLRRRALDLDGGTLRIYMQRERDNSKLVDLKTGFSAATMELMPAAVEAIREAMRFKREQALKPKKSSREGAGFANHNYLFHYFKADLEKLMEIHREVAPQDFRRREVGKWGGDAWHVYRHTYATLLARQGVDREKIHDLLRHRDQKTTDAYLRALLVDVRGGDDVRRAMENKKAMQQQAIAERSGKGLSIVPPRKR